MPARAPANPVLKGRPLEAAGYDFCTSSPDKAREIADALGVPVRLIPQEVLKAADSYEPQLLDSDRPIWNDPNRTAEQRSLLCAAHAGEVKAREAWTKFGEQLGIFPVVEDVSLWPLHTSMPFPGLNVKDVSESPNTRDDFIAAVNGLEARRGPLARLYAVVVTYSVYHPITQSQFRQAVSECRVVGQRRWRRGIPVFGFDDMLEVQLPGSAGSWKTLAELDTNQKKALFARGKALEKLKQRPFSLPSVPRGLPRLG
jgi:inosine/xanthosine triphosphate pyrophosphatase family protein